MQNVSSVYNILLPVVDKYQNKNEYNKSQVIYLRVQSDFYVEKDQVWNEVRCYFRLLTNLPDWFHDKQVISRFDNDDAFFTWQTCPWCYNLEL